MQFLTTALNVINLNGNHVTKYKSGARHSKHCLNAKMLGTVTSQ